jgi:hypothetical protein
MMRWSPLFVFAFASLLWTTPASAETCGGIEMADSTEVEETELVLNGLGLREATIFSVDVYVAGLYLEETSGDRSGPEVAASDTKKRLVLHFVRGVGKKKMVDAYRESFKKNGGDRYGSIKSKVDRLLGWISSVEEGQRHVYTYVPGEGVTIEIEGTTKGTIEGSTFGELFFEIWLGDPPNEGLKRGLLGGACG